MHIPGKSGLDILKELHGEDYPAPIFMISGQGDIAMAVNAIKSGAIDFIEKPFKVDRLVLVADRALASQVEVALAGHSDMRRHRIDVEAAISR